MFDFDAGKLLIIGIVALVVIGPKDLPRVLRQLGQAIAKMRRMAAEFQGQFMEAMKEADMADLKADMAKLADSAKVDVGFNPVQDIKSQLTAAIEQPSKTPEPSPAPETEALPAVASEEPASIEEQPIKATSMPALATEPVVAMAKLPEDTTLLSSGVAAVAPAMPMAEPKTTYVQKEV